MDANEATRVVFSRIQTLDPENASKIMGFLLIQDNGDKEMIRLAFGPETLLHSIILKARKELGLLNPNPSSPSSSPFLLTRQSSGHQPWDFIDDLQLHDQFPFLAEPSAGHHPYRRSCSPAADAADLGWRPCLYYARGYCKNGNGCKFQHGLLEEMKMDAMVEQHCRELLLRTKAQIPPPPPPPSFPYSPTSPLPPSRSALEALIMGAGSEEAFKFTGRYRSDYAAMASPSARQIYLTFPADSTFKEEDVSNYFSMYGPVQDVRIPYQQKRMFGFVTFVYPETVRLILAKGNPHFVCDARVLVKPYKEKGKVPDKFRRQQQQSERGDFSGCTTPTAIELQLGARMLFSNSNQEILLRRKLEEQQQALELQQAIELQRRQFMGLQLHDIKTRSSLSTSPSDGSHEDGSPEDKSMSPALLAGTAVQQSNNHTSSNNTHELVHQSAVKVAEKEESGGGDVSPKDDGDFQESEHNLPDSPFASPTKSSSTFNPYLLQIQSTWNAKAVEN
ncbi:putative transcription factor C3H family [Dioscorea sansibarensis]